MDSLLHAGYKNIFHSSISKLYLTISIKCELSHNVISGKDSRLE